MKLFYISLFSLIVSGFNLFAEQADTNWHTEIESALEKAKAENKDVLIDFCGSDWCPPCMHMHKEVYSKDEFLEKVQEKFVLVRIDFPQKNKELAEKNKPLREKYKIMGLPTAVLLKSNGDVYHKFIAAKYGKLEAFLKYIDLSYERKDMD